MSHPEGEKFGKEDLGVGLGPTVRVPWMFSSLLALLLLPFLKDG